MNKPQLAFETPIQYLKGVGPAVAKKLKRLNIKTVYDLVNHYPSRHEDFSQVNKINQVKVNQTVTLIGQITEIKTNYTRSARRMTIQRAILADNTDEIQIVWFNQAYLEKSLNKKTISVSGVIKRNGNYFQLVSPKFEIISSGQIGQDNLSTGRWVPIYPTTFGLSNKYLRKIIKTALDSLKNQIEEYLPQKIIQKEKFLSLKTAIGQIHFPSDQAKLKAAKKRLGFDELFLLQLKHLINKSNWKEKQPAPKLVDKKKQADKLTKSLPFKLTGAQTKAIKEILADIKKPKAMNRLLCGDVGSGKTIVAAIAALICAQSSYQAIFMAPTEILAQQHFKTLEKLFSKFKLKTQLITGSTKKITQKQLVSPNIIIGTHALLHRQKQFEKIGLIVIDEQHRFGVKQRAIIIKDSKLKDKDKLCPHILTMTATPIPRTVTLTMYGDLDVSTLNEMPKGRRPVKTFVVNNKKRDDCYAWIKKQIKEKKHQAFIICPFIEPSETLVSVKDAIGEYEKLKSKVFTKQKLALIHGRMKSKEKETILTKMKNGKIDILVATPVVEVGIDIPNANVIVIETANRFGLAQLHQLRGRVGRNDQQAHCFLFASKTSQKAQKRLKAMENNNNGLVLSEIDLKIRGPGEIYGTSQSGFPEFKIASYTNIRLIQKARNYAQQIIVKDQNLEKHPKMKERLSQQYSLGEIALN